MSRIVVVTIEVDPKAYDRADDSPKGCVELVTAMLRGQADLPDDAERVVLHCGTVILDLAEAPNG